MEDSSVIADFWWDHRLGLTIKFCSGRVYCYPGAFLCTYNDLVKAASKGTYFNSGIKPYFTGIEIRTGPIEEPVDDRPVILWVWEGGRIFGGQAVVVVAAKSAAEARVKVRAKHVDLGDVEPKARSEAVTISVRSSWYGERSLEVVT
jgi:hypothetical protein